MALRVRAKAWSSLSTKKIQEGRDKGRQEERTREGQEDDKRDRYFIDKSISNLYRAETSFPWGARSKNQNRTIELEAKCQEQHEW
jgi:hypothetical protein